MTDNAESCIFWRTRNSTPNAATLSENDFCGDAWPLSVGWLRFPWAFAETTEAYQIDADFKAKDEGGFNRMIQLTAMPVAAEGVTG